MLINSQWKKALLEDGADEKHHECIRDYIQKWMDDRSLKYQINIPFITLSEVSDEQFDENVCGDWGYFCEGRGGGQSLTCFFAIEEDAVLFKLTWS